MRILTLHNRYQMRGGEDVSTEAEFTLLREHGHDVLAWFEDNRSFTYADRWQIGRRLIWSHASYNRTRKLIRFFKPDLLNAHNLFPLFSPSVIQAAVAEGVPVVQTLHNFRLVCPGAGLFRAGRVCENCLEKWLPWPSLVHGCYRQSRMATGAVAGMCLIHRAIGTWEGVSLFLTASEFARRKFIQAGFPGGRIRVKPNFLAQDPGIGSGDGNFAVFAGRISPEKGVLTLLEAWTKIGQSFPLKVIGDGPQLREVAQKAGRLRSVELLGYQDAAQVYWHMGQAKAVIVPSEWPETFGRVVIEAFAKGTPVIASNLGALTELVEHGRTGLLFRPGDAEDLAAKVDWFLTHPAEAAQMRREARVEFLAKYTAERNYQMLMEIYESVLNGRQSQTQPAARAARAAGHAD